jgi:hypothetical protein
MCDMCRERRAAARTKLRAKAKRRKARAAKLRADARQKLNGAKRHR